MLCASFKTHLTSVPLAQNQWSAGSRKNPQSDHIAYPQKKSFYSCASHYYMSINSFWTPIKFTVLSAMPNCSCPSSSQQHKYAENRLHFLLHTPIHEPLDLSLPSLDEWHLSVCHIIQMQYLRLLPYYPNAIPSTLSLCWTNCLQFHSGSPFSRARACLV